MGWHRMRRAIPYLLPPLRIAAGIGISLIARFLTHQYIDCEPKQGDEWLKWIESWCYAFSLPIMALAFGWIVHLFM